MKKPSYLFTSESVTEGHPDKVADQISDAILDAIYARDPDGRVACETLVTTGLAFVSGEITTSCYVDIPKVVRKTIRDIGYDDPQFGFDADTLGVMTAIQSQSPDIAMGVDTGGAGDQGMMFGYASNETKELMPMPIMLAHQLTLQLATVRKAGTLKALRPDGKSQVTVEYVDGKPKRVTTVLISTNHKPKVTMDQLKQDVIETIITPVVPAALMSKSTRILVNPTGRFEVGGPQADTGLTGRKIIQDTYGGMGRHGGGAFSGKDPSKVDRSAAYMARYVAKNLVAAGLAARCEVELAYAIGVAEPVSVMVETFGTGKISDVKLCKLIRTEFDMTPRAIMRTLKLRRPIYLKTASYGHFGRNEDGFTWEETDRVKSLQTAARKM